MAESSVELSGAQEVRLRVLDLVRQMTVGEDVPVDDLLVLAAWVVDGDHGPALQMRAQLTEAYRDAGGTVGDAVSYRSVPR